MAARSIIKTIKAVFGGNIAQLTKEHNKLVDEVEELKGHYKVHTHSAVATKAPDGNTGTGFTPAYATAEAQKVAP